MLLILLLLATQNPETAIDAERAFNRAAQTEGQWTAFRKFMTDDGVVFTPQPVKAKEALPEKNPPIAVQWWPAESYVSCDGTTAVNTGPWVRPKGFGYFTTVWERQADGHYKWVYDGGDALTTPRPLPEKPKIRRASCSKPRFLGNEADDPGQVSGGGVSKDGTLHWNWTIIQGNRTFVVNLWNGHGFDRVILDEVTAPK
jgi:hypothetical protein